MNFFLRSFIKIKHLIIKQLDNYLDLFITIPFRHKQYTLNSVYVNMINDK